MNCFNCKFWRPLDENERIPEESLGNCEFPIVLPYSMRLCLREKVSTYGDQGEFCKLWVKKND